MDRTAVSSSNIKSVGFDPSNNIVEIEFSDGSIYQYFDVPEATYQSLVGAPSVGKYFHQEIRGTYRFARL